MSRIDTFRIFIAVFLSIAMVGSMVAPYTGIAVADNDEQDETTSATTIECQIATDLQKAGAIGNGEDLDTPTECLQAIDKGKSVQGLPSAIEALQNHEYEENDEDENKVITKIEVRSAVIKYVENDDEITRITEKRNGDIVNQVDIVTKSSEINVLQDLKNDNYENKEDDSTDENTQKDDTNTEEQTGPDSDSILDYSIDGGKLSVYPNEFRDSNVPNEAFESSSIPPFGTEGKITSFRDLTVGQKGTTQITNGSDGNLDVGIAFYGLPTHQDTTYLYTNSSKYPDDVSVVFRKQLGEEIATTEFEKAVKIPKKVMEHADKRASIYITLESNEPVNFELNCMSVVVNAGDAPKSCDEGRVEVTDITTTNNTDVGTAKTVQLDGTERSASILEYDYSTENRDEGVTYSGTYYDGDGGQEYIESTLPIYGNPHGHIKNYPALSDGDNSTAATLKADKNGLHVMMKIDNIEKGKYHMFAVRWDVESGSKPDIRFQTADGKLLEVPRSDMGDKGFHTADLSKISNRINSGRTIFVTYTSNNPNTKVKIYCQTVVSNPKEPQNSTCYGTIPEKQQQLKENENVVNSRNIKEGQKLFKKYVYKVKTYENTTKTAANKPGNGWKKVRSGGVKPVHQQRVVRSTQSPGPSWYQGEQVGSNTYKETKVRDSVDKPGSDWVRVKKVGEKTYTKTKTKNSLNSPGNDWNRAKKVGTQRQDKNKVVKSASMPSGDGWTRGQRVGTHEWVETKVRNSAEKPGKKWVKQKQVGTKEYTVYKRTQSTKRPGSEWIRGSAVREKKVQINTLTRVSKDKPGNDWQRNGVDHVRTNYHSKTRVSKNKPGSEWDKVRLEYTRQVFDKWKYKTDKQPPGPDWKRITETYTKQKQTGWIYTTIIGKQDIRTAKSGAKGNEWVFVEQWKNTWYETKVSHNSPGSGWSRDGLHHKKKIEPAEYKTKYKWKKQKTRSVTKYVVGLDKAQKYTPWNSIEDVTRVKVEPAEYEWRNVKVDDADWDWVKVKVDDADYDRVKVKVDPAEYETIKKCNTDTNYKSISDKNNAYDFWWNNVNQGNWNYVGKYFGDYWFKKKTKNCWTERKKVDDADYDRRYKKIDDADYDRRYKKVDDANYDRRYKKVDDAEWKTKYRINYDETYTDYKFTLGNIDPFYNGWEYVSSKKVKVEPAKYKKYYEWKKKFVEHKARFKKPKYTTVQYYLYGKKTYKTAYYYQWKKTWTTKTKIYKWKKPVYEWRTVYKWRKPIQKTKPVYKWEKKVRKQKPIYRWKKPVEKRNPVYKWKKQVEKTETIYRWKKTVTKSQPVYRWKRSVTEFDRVYVWKSVDKNVVRKESLSPPTNKGNVVGDVDLRYPPCKSGTKLAEQSEFCNEE